MFTPLDLLAHCSQPAVKSRVALVNQLCHMRCDGSLNWFGVDLGPGPVNVVAKVAQLALEVELHLRHEVVSVVEGLKGNFGNHLVAEIVELHLHVREIGLGTHHVELSFDLHKLGLLSVNGFLNAGLVLGAFFNLQVDGFCVALNLFYALDYFVLKDLLTLLKLRYLFVGASRFRVAGFSH